MNDKIIISTDCTCDLPESLLKKYSIEVIPFYISMNDVRFQDCVEVNSTALVEHLEIDTDTVSSAPATESDYKSYFEKLAQKGTVIHISVSGKQSTAYDNAVLGAKGMDNVHVVDSFLVSLGLGLLVLAAADLAKRSATVEIILDQLRVIRTKISCSIILKSTQQIASNNRVSQIMSNLMTFFRIKPILKMKNGRMKISGACFGNRTAYAKKYIKKVLRRKKNISDDILFIAVSGCSEEFQELVYNEAADKVSWKQIFINDVSVSNLCNIGLGSIGMMFYTK